MTQAALRNASGSADANANPTPAGNTFQGRRQRLAQARFGYAGEWHYTVSYNRWTGPLERIAEALPASACKAAGQAHYDLVGDQPQDRNALQFFAVIRRPDGLLDRYWFIACDEWQTDLVWVSERHQLKGDKESLFSEVLNGLDLHHQPCAALIANEIYYLIAAPAYDLMVAIKLLELPDACQSWRVKTLMKKLLFLPGQLSWRARPWVGHVLVAAVGATGVAEARRGPAPAGGRQRLRRPSNRSLAHPSWPGRH